MTEESGVNEPVSAELQVQTGEFQTAAQVPSTVGLWTFVPRKTEVRLRCLPKAFCPFCLRSDPYLHVPELTHESLETRQKPSGVRPPTCSVCRVTVDVEFTKTL